MNVWFTPAAARAAEGRLPARASDEPCGPGVLVLTPEDLRGPEQAAWREQLERALPGRPVLVGGFDDRRLLLDAINLWRVFRVVPAWDPPELVEDAIAKAREAAATELRLVEAAAALEAETRDLSAAIDHLGATRDHLLHSDRLRELGRLSGGLSNLLGAHCEGLATFHEVLRGQDDDPELAEVFECAFEGLRGMQALLDEMRGYADESPRPDALTDESLDELVAGAVAFSRYDPLARTRRVRTCLAAGARVRIDKYRFHPVLLNLIRNAFQATTRDNRVEVRTGREGPMAWVDVQDDGPGMSPEVQARLFEPFFTTKGSEGMGLGLVLCRKTIERFGGTLTCDSVPGQGTRMRITLPTLDATHS